MDPYCSYQHEKIFPDLKKRVYAGKAGATVQEVDSP